MTVVPTNLNNRFTIMLQYVVVSILTAYYTGTYLTDVLDNLKLMIKGLQKACYSTKTNT